MTLRIAEHDIVSKMLASALSGTVPTTQSEF
jgi:hypothetical protein